MPIEISTHLSRVEEYWSGESVQSNASGWVEYLQFPALIPAVIVSSVWSRKAYKAYKA